MMINLHRSPFVHVILMFASLMVSAFADETADGVKLFDKYYKSNGMSGVLAGIRECYDNFSRNKSVKLAKSCFTLDFAANRVDTAMADGIGFPQQEFIKIEKVLSRANAALSSLGLDQDKRGERLSEWSLAVISAIQASLRDKQSR